MIPSGKQPDKDNPTVRLMKAMAFGGKDLDLNRAGELSDLQKRQLHHEFYGVLLLWLLFVLVIGALFVGIVLQIPLDYRASNPAPYLVALMGCGAAVGFLYAFYKHHKNVSTAGVTAFTGRVRLHKGAKEAFLLVINYAEKAERIFSISGAVRALIEGETYTFYSPSFDESRYISAEHVPDYQ